jgi:hypothetical protein
LSNPNCSPKTGQARPSNFEANREVRNLLANAIKSSRRKRAEIAEQMSALLGRSVTESMLNDFTRGCDKGRDVRFPAAWIGPFCEAVGNDDLRRHVMGQRLRQLLTLGEAVEPLLQNAGKKARK